MTQTKFQEDNPGMTLDPYDRYLMIFSLVLFVLILCVNLYFFTLKRPSIYRNRMPHKPILYSIGITF